MKKNGTKEVKIAIAVIISLFVLYYGVNFLKGTNIFKPQNSYLAAFNNVSGLKPGSPVNINGYKVGLVFSMQMSADGKKVLATLNLDEGVKILKGSKITIDPGIVSGASLMIEQNPDGKEYYAPTDTIEGDKNVSLMDDITSQLMPQVNRIMPRIDTVLVALQLLLSDPALKASLQNIETATENLSLTSRKLDHLVAALDSELPPLVQNFNAAGTKLSNVASNFEQVNIPQTFNKLDSTIGNLQRLSAQFNGKDNTVGLLLNDRQLYDSLSITISNAAVLLQDIKDNPKKYINLKVF